MSRENKKNKFKGQDNKKPNTVFLGAIAVGIALIVGIFLFSGKDQAANSPYAGRVVQQSMVDYVTEEGKILVEESELNTKEFIKFNVQLNTPVVADTWGGKQEFSYMPVTAYRDHNGVLVGVIGLCEPCAGESMRIEGGNLVCNKCTTVWDLNTLKGIAGGCKDYPPIPLKVEIKDGKIVFDESEIQNFEPRPL